MNPQSVISLGQQAITIAILICLPPLGLALIVGLSISIVQALTQIQDQTLTFVPKIAAVALSLFLFGSWMLYKLTDFTVSIIGNLDKFGR